MPTFVTAAPISATIDLPVATVRISAGDRADTIVDVRPSDPTKERDVQAAELTRVDLADGELMIDVPKRRAWLGGKEGSVDVAVALPSGSALRATVGVGDVEADGRLGDCRVKTGVGEISVDEVDAANLASGVGDVSLGHATGRTEVISGTGQVRVAAFDGAALLKNANGDTWVGVARGELRIKGANGDIDIDVAHADVDAKTANGDVRLGMAVRGSVVLESHLGDIEIGVREGTAAWLDVRSGLGKVVIELDAADGPDPAAETVSIRARTSLGQVRVHRSGTSTASSASGARGGDGSAPVPKTSESSSHPLHKLVLALAP